MPQHHPRPERWHWHVIGPRVGAQDRPVVALPACHVERTHAVGAHVAERHRLDRFVDASGRHARGLRCLPPLWRSTGLAQGAGGKPAGGRNARSVRANEPQASARGSGMARLSDLDFIERPLGAPGAGTGRHRGAKGTLRSGFCWLDGASGSGDGPLVPLVHALAPTPNRVGAPRPRRAGRAPLSSRHGGTPSRSRWTARRWSRAPTASPCSTRSTGAGVSPMRSSKPSICWNSMGSITGRCRSAGARIAWRGYWPACRSGSSSTSTPTRTAPWFPARLQDGPRRHRVKAARCALPVRALAGLDQGQEPGGPGHAAVPWGVMVTRSRLDCAHVFGKIWLETNRHRPRRSGRVADGN
jgi:hypothetical protein